MDQDRRRQRARGEVTLLVEYVVIGQLALEAGGADFALFGVDNRIAQRAVVLAPDGGDEQAEAVRARLRRQRPGGAHRLLDELRLEEQILRKIAGQEQFGEQQHVSLGNERVGDGFSAEPEIFRQGSNAGIELCQRYAKSIGH